MNSAGGAGDQSSRGETEPRIRMDEHRAWTGLPRYLRAGVTPASSGILGSS